jgi:hypothetical protein
MKTFRKSASAHRRNAQKDIAARGCASAPPALTPPPEAILRGRNLRRATRTGRVDSSRLNVLVRDVGGNVVRPTLTLIMDERTRTVLGCVMS